MLLYKLMVHELPDMPDVAREAYEQSLFTDMAEQLALERGLRNHSEEMLKETLDSAAITVRALFRHKERVSVLEDQVTELSQEVKRDKLTGLLEKTAWNREVESMIEQQKSFGIIYIDLTNFKWINDKISHHEGDRVLIDFADMLKNSVRTNRENNADMITYEEINLEEYGAWAGRLGGDEFALLVDLTPTEDESLSSDQRLDKVIHRLDELCKYFLEEEPELAEGGFDFAIAGAVRKEDDTAKSVIDRAEKNMYRRKRSQHRQKGRYR